MVFLVWILIQSDFEEHYHSFVGEATSERWGITSCRKYLRGKKFYWIYDYIAIKKILEYSWNIHQIRRWSQESFGY